MRVEAPLWLHRLVFFRESKRPHPAPAVTASTVTSRPATVSPTRPWVRVETLPDKCQPRYSATGLIRKLASHLLLPFTRPVPIAADATTRLPTHRWDHEGRASRHKDPSDNIIQKIAGIFTRKGTRYKKKEATTTTTALASDILPVAGASRKRRANSHCAATALTYLASVIIPVADASRKRRANSPDAAHAPTNTASDPVSVA